MILQVDENFDFSVFMSEITTNFLFVQKIYKDCTLLQYNNGSLQAINPLVLNPKIAVQHEFLHELLVFFKKACKNIIKEDQIQSLNNSLYQISTVMNSILKIIETNYVQDYYSIFTFENSILVVDILSLLMPKS